MFSFRIVDCGNGIQTFDMTLKTPYNSLTPAQMVEYQRAEEQIYTANRIRRQETKNAGGNNKRKKILKNLIWKLSSFCGLV